VTSAGPAENDWRQARRGQVADRRRRRRMLVVDVVIALGFAAVLLAALPGLGVVAWFALPLLVLGLIWIGAERALAARRRRARTLPPDPR
jgi:Flp pilus assembly protein TadB